MINSIFFKRGEHISSTKGLQNHNAIQELKKKVISQEINKMVCLKSQIKLLMAILRLPKPSKHNS